MDRNESIFLTNYNAIITNSSDRTETYTQTINSSGFAVFDNLRYGVTYEVSVEGCLTVKTLLIESDDDNYITKQYRVKTYDGYTAEIYFRDHNYEVITSRPTVTVVNTNDNNETYQFTMNSEGYIEAWLKHGVTYSVSVSGYTDTNTFMYNSDIGSYKAIEFTLNN